MPKISKLKNQMSKLRFRILLIIRQSIVKIVKILRYNEGNLGQILEFYKLVSFDNVCVVLCLSCAN
jgi:hypothetical protein